MLPALLFAAYFTLMAALIGYICWTGRPPGVFEAEVEAVDLPLRVRDGDEDTQLAA